jgi:hypothetical protein
MMSKPELPKLPLPGIDPWLTVEDDANRAYAAYWGGSPLVDRYLVQHNREDIIDFNIRKRLSYGLARTQRAVHWLTRTVANPSYAIERDFGPAYPELAALAAHAAPSGKTWDTQLKALLSNTLLGSVSYIFLDQATLPPTLDTQADIDNLRTSIETILIRSQQVWDIVLTPDGYIRQCSIITSSPQGDRLIQYFESPLPMFRVYFRKNDRSKWELTEESPNALGVAPLVPLIVNGDLNEPESIRTNVQAASRLDIDMMNQLSDARQAFGLHNYPILAMPESESAGNPRMGLAGKLEPAEEKKTLSAARGIRYDAKNGQPFFLESEHIYLDQTITLINYLSELIDDIIGVDLAPDHPLASGVAKQFDFQDQSEVFRANHARLQAVEYQCWYLIARMVAPGRLADFQGFKQDVIIQHPTHFDPTGGHVRERLDLIIDSPEYANASPEIRLAVQQRYWRTNLDDLIPQDQLSILIDTIQLDKEVINDRTGFPAPNNSATGTGI